MLKITLDFTDLRNVLKKAEKSVLDHKLFAGEITEAYRTDLKDQFDADGVEEYTGTSNIWSDNTAEWDAYKKRVTGVVKKMQFRGKLVKNLLSRKIKIHKSGKAIQYIWEWWAKRKDFDYAQHYQDGAKYPREFNITPELEEKLEAIIVRNIEREISRL